MLATQKDQRERPPTNNFMKEHTGVLRELKPGLGPMAEVQTMVQIVNDELFKIKNDDIEIHRYTEDRAIWIIQWILGPLDVRTVGQSLETLKTHKLMDFLKTVWSSPYFTFTGFDDAVGMVGDGESDCDFVIRLSESQQNKISVTIMHDGEPHSTRYAVEDGLIVYDRAPHTPKQSENGPIYELPPRYPIGEFVEKIEEVIGTKTAIYTMSIPEPQVVRKVEITKVTEVTQVAVPAETAKTTETTVTAVTVETAENDEAIEKLQEIKKSIQKEEEKKRRMLNDFQLNVEMKSVELRELRKRLEKTEKELKLMLEEETEKNKKAEEKLQKMKEEMMKLQLAVDSQSDSQSVPVPSWAAQFTGKKSLSEAIEDTEDGEDGEDEGVCQMCREEPINTAFDPCGHAWCCSGCSEAIKVKFELCPVCQESYDKVLTLHMA